MATENFSTYTEQDADSKVTVTSSRITFTAANSRTANYWVYKDYTAGHFTDFTHLVTVTVSTANLQATACPWMLANGIGDFKTAQTAGSGLVVYVYSDTPKLGLFDCSNSNEVSYDATAGTVYYLTIQRSGTSLTCKIYSDSSRLFLLTTLSITCATTSFRYVYGFACENRGSGAAATTGYVENLDLQEGSSSSSSSCRSSSSSSSSCRSSSSSCRSSSSSSSSSISSISSSSSSCRSSSSSSRSMSSSSSSCRSSSSSSCSNSSSSSSCRSSSSSSSSFSTQPAVGYYFSKAGSNTTGTGTIGNPWYMFKGKLNGVNALVPGDHVYFNRGDIWVGSEAEVVVNSSGSSGNPIVLNAYGTGADPIFAGGDIVTVGWSVHIGVIYKLLGQTQTHLKNVTQNENKALCQWRGTNDTLPEGTFKRESSTLYVHLWSDANPATSTVRVPSFAHSEGAQGERGLISSSHSGGGSGSYVEFNNLHVIGANGIGFSASGLTNKFYDCTAMGCGQEGMLFYSFLSGTGENADGGRWFRGEISYCACMGTGFGQGTTTYAPRCWWDHAYVHDNFMAGIDFLDFSANTNVTECGASFCRVENNGRWRDGSSYDSNIYIDGGSEIYLYGNKVSGSGTLAGATNARPGINIGSEHPTTKPAENIYVINNLVFRNHWIGIGSDNPGTSTTNIKNVKIINNTVYAWQSSTFDMCWNAGDVDTTADNWVMKNNLFLGGGSNNLINLYTNAGAYLDADYNLFYRLNGSSNLYSTDGGSTLYTLATWRTLSGEDANSINVNPQLISTNENTPDAHITAVTSPAINSGIISAFVVPSWVTGMPDYSTIFPHGAAVYGYATSDGILDDTTSTIDIGYHYETSGISSSSCSSSSCRSSSSSSSSSSCRSSSSSSSSKSSSSSSSSRSISSSSCSSSSSSSSMSSSSSSKSFASVSSSSSSSSSRSLNTSSSSSSSCRSSSSSSSCSSSCSSSSSKSSSSSSCRSSSSSCRSSSSSSSSRSSSSSSCRSSSSSCRSSSSSSSSFSNAINQTGGVIKVSSEITYKQRFI